KALQTGEADRDGDSYISVDELYDYVVDQVRLDTPNQTPEKWSDPGETFIVARSVRSPSPASPELPPEPPAYPDLEELEAAAREQLAVETSAREQLALEANLAARYEEAVSHLTAG